jgi:hypothetical protein
LVALVFGRAESRSQEATRSLGIEIGPNPGKEHPQEVFREKQTV